jgi:hypothetical protein
MSSRVHNLLGTRERSVALILFYYDYRASSSFFLRIFFFYSLKGNLPFTCSYGNSYVLIEACSYAGER